MMYTRNVEESIFINGILKLQFQAKTKILEKQDQPVLHLTLKKIFVSVKLLHEKLTKQLFYVESCFRELDKKILSEITDRNYDDALLVYERIEFAPDLHDADATYHRAFIRISAVGNRFQRSTIPVIPRKNTIV